MRNRAIKTNDIQRGEEGGEYVTVRGGGLLKVEFSNL